MKKKVAFKFILPVILLLMMSVSVGLPLFYNGFFAIAELQKVSSLVTSA